MHQKTITLGVIGDPIAHSLSPYLHKYLIRKHHLPGCYHAFQVRAEQLRAAIFGAQALGFRGLNITIPHKQAVMQYADALTDIAARAGAVNTVTFANGRIYGDNTDISGFLQNLTMADVRIQNRDVFIIGAGGAARAVALAALAEGAKSIYIANRTMTRAEELARAVAGEPVSPEVVLKLSPGAIVVNATPVGMSPNSDQSPLPEALYRSDLIYVDLVYHPLRTRFLQFAEMKGAKAVDGLGMLIFQGVLSLEKWTGEKLDVMPYFEALKQFLAGKIEKKLSSFTQKARI